MLLLIVGGATSKMDDDKDDDKEEKRNKINKEIEGRADCSCSKKEKEEDKLRRFCRCYKKKMVTLQEKGKKSLGQIRFDFRC
mmetsp:Transcript_19117/g.28939  ORF Transcript_19117/g.28939 Transcript_19117/m.28939 type:complete len:82 (-) Transcript_19117:2463-2708(-)